MTEISFLDLREQLAAALQRPLTPPEARLRVKLCLADVGKELLLSDLLPPELEADLADPFGIDDVAALEGIVMGLRRQLSHLPEVACRLPVLSFWVAALGGPASQWHLGRYVAELALPTAQHIPQCPSGDPEMAAGLERAWVEHEHGVADMSITTDPAEAAMINICFKAAAAFLVFKEMERALDVPAQDASDFMMKCQQADASQRRWDDLVDNVCRLPARSAPGRYAKHRLAELLGRLEPSAPQDGAFERIIVSAREDKARFGFG